MQRMISNIRLTIKTVATLNCVTATELFEAMWHQISGQEKSRKFLAVIFEFVICLTAPIRLKRRANKAG
ncbi:MAG: hypothetical protein NZ937_08380 [Armatimonadetes bacterium]|nr:hypothetical protein [Armatimonadota bacterium]